MHYLLFCDVVPDYLERRAAYRAEHLALARAAAERGELLAGGALADPVDGDVLLFEAATPAVAEAFAKADPYVERGIVTRWRAQWIRVCAARNREDNRAAHRARMVSVAAGGGCIARLLPCRSEPKAGIRHQRCRSEPKARNLPLATPRSLGRRCAPARDDASATDRRAASPRALGRMRHFPV